MFENWHDYEIINFLNSIIRAEKIKKYSSLFKTAIEELQKRGNKTMILYQFYVDDFDE